MKQQHRKVSHHLVVLLMPLILILAACGGSDPYIETFDDAGNWRTGSDDFARGEVTDGVYDLLVRWDDHLSRTTAGESFADGVYEVEATQLEGPVDNGYGMVFRADDEAGDFYLFMVSGDGFVWIGRYRGEGELEAEAMIGDWWFESPAVQRGTERTNRLRVRAEGGNLIFFVNDQEVGRVTDSAFASGDIGLAVRTLGQGGVRVQFDNFRVSPLEN